MEFVYFKAAWDTPLEDLKKQYHKLALKHHPDRGGSEDAFKQVNAEWDYLQKHNYYIHRAANGSTYMNEREEAPDDLTARFAKIINALICLEGIEIEICGSFIWLSGDTYQWKDTLKALGFKWGRKKQKWYMAPKNYRRKGGEWSMERIRAKYGSFAVTEGVYNESDSHYLPEGTAA